jgi:hypothetical protein
MVSRPQDILAQQQLQSPVASYLEAHSLSSRRCGGKVGVAGEEERGRSGGDSIVC